MGIKTLKISRDSSPKFYATPSDIFGRKVVHLNNKNNATPRSGEEEDLTPFFY